MWGITFLEKALELGIEGWVGEYLSDREGIPGRRNGINRNQRYVMCGKRQSLVELIIRGWGEGMRKRNRSGKASAKL